MQKKVEVKIAERIKLSPNQSTGDCGYHAVIIGLFYLALKANEDELIASAINSSRSIRQLLDQQPDNLQRSLKKPFKTNHECLLSYLDLLDTSGFYKPSFNEFINNFTKELKQINSSSDWLRERIQNEIKSGLWPESNRQWDGLSSFQPIKRKIQLKADALYEKATQAKRRDLDSDLLSQIIFQAHIDACGELTYQELELSANEIITHFYTVNSPKAWLDIEFLKCLVRDLLGASDMMFDKSALQITGQGASAEHWYIDLPHDKHTKFILKMGDKTGFSVVPSNANVEVPLSSFSQPGDTEIFKSAMFTPS